MMKSRRIFPAMLTVFILFAAIPQSEAYALASDDYVMIKASDWGIVQHTAHNDRASAEANTAAIQNAIDTLYEQGHRKMRLEKMDVAIWGAHPWGDSTWGGNPYENHETGIVMRTGMSFDMNGSIFRLATNDRPRYCLIMIGVPATEYLWDPVNRKSSTGPTIYTTDVEIFNGTLIGDRWEHDYWQDVADTQNPDGSWVSTHEFGMGISVGSNAERTKIHNMTIRDITGDCIGIAGKDTEIFNCDISYGRRNGICSAGADGIKIYNNYIHDIWNDVVIPQKTHNQSTLTDYQKEMGVTYGIGAEACIAFEGGRGIFNVEIYGNFLNGHSESPYTQGAAINFHWGTMGIRVYDNIINGDIAQVQGSNIIIEGNKLFNGGYSVSGGTTTYNGHLVDEDSEQYLGGRSDIRNCIFIGNYCLNYGVYTRAPIKTGYESYPGQENGTNFAFIGNRFVNGKIQAHSGVRTAFIGNLLNFEGRDTGSGFWLCLSQEPINKGNNNGTFLYAFNGNLVQLIEEGTWNRDTPGIRYSRTYSDANSGYNNLHRIQLENKDALDAEALKDITDVYPWYRETDNAEEINAFLSNFKIMGPYELPVWTDWYSAFLLDLDNWYSINDEFESSPLYNGGALPPGGFIPPITFEEEAIKFFPDITDFVTRLYRNVLGREPDLHGLSSWVLKLANNYYSGAEIAFEFYLSIEFLTADVSNEKYIDNLYQTMLGRPAAEDPLSINWLNQLDEGKSRVDMVAEFVVSEEFGNYCEAAGITVGEPKPQEEANVRAFVWRFYYICLDRAPDETGLREWTGRLINNEYSGTQIAREFVICEEMDNKIANGLGNDEFVTALYTAMLGRAPDDIGREKWTDEMNRGMMHEGLFGEFAASEEFRNVCSAYGIRP